MKLYHVATPKKAKLYRQSGAIHAPVRGFTTFIGALAWACKVGCPQCRRRVHVKHDLHAQPKGWESHGKFQATCTCRTVIYEIDEESTHKLPDHHNRYGEAYWIDRNVTNFKCIFSTEKDA